MFRVLAALSAVAITTASVIDSAELLPVPSDYRFHARPAHGISDPGSPWITGPKNNKYQFHIGRQSWLAAREHCLAQNSDLVVIGDTEELDWVLSHYAPAQQHFIERLIQVGFYIDSHDGIREWHWTNHKSLNTSALSWVSGEPFDHANGHERCAVLRVNAAALDDVDCDLPGSETKMYRFICQRSHEAHVKHEEVNNPLWKKLQDILDFFGISRPSGENSSENKTRPGEDEEDYWEMVKKENTTDSENTSNATETTVAAVKETVEASEAVEGSGEEVTDSVPEATSAPVQTHGAKTSENAVIADELLINDSLQKINSAEEAATTDASPTTLKKEEIIIETASIETTRTTKPDPLEKPSPKKSGDQIHYVDVLQKHMDKLEKIVNAVEHMIDPIVDEDNELDGDLGEIAESKNENYTDANIPEMAEIIANDMANMEEDFQEAALETKQHPGINSGDFVAVPNEHQENIELCENDEEETTPAPTRAQKIEKFLTSLQRFLNRSSNKKLKDLVDESKLKGKSLLEKIDEAVMEQTAEQLQKMIEIQGNLTDRPSHKKTEVSEGSTTSATTSVNLENVTETDGTTTAVPTETTETTSTDSVETSTTAIQEVLSKVTAEVEAASTAGEAETTEAVELETTPSADGAETTEALEVETTLTTEEASSENVEPANPEVISPTSLETNSLSVNTTNEQESATIVESTTLGTLNTGTDNPKTEETVSPVSDSNSSTPPAAIVEFTTATGSEIESSTAATSLPIDETTVANLETTEPSTIEALNNSTEQQSSNNQSILEVTKESITEVKKNSRSEQKNAEVKKHSETESLFPTPDFSLIKPGQGIPEDVLKSVQEEAVKIGAAYEEFNRRMDTSKLVQHIQEKEANGVLKNKPLLDSLPLSSRTDKRPPTVTEKQALLELEKMFIDLGKNFQAISQG